MPEVLEIKHWKDDDELHERGWDSMEDFSEDLSYPADELAACWFVEIYDGDKYPQEMDKSEIPPGEEITLTVSQVIHSRLFHDSVRLRVLERMSDDVLIAVPLDDFCCG